MVSQLDPGQIVKRVYDEANDRIRVDASVTAPSGTAIVIDDVDDSIKIGNGSNVFADVTASHALKVAITDSDGNDINNANPLPLAFAFPDLTTIYNEITSVPSSSNTQIINYTISNPDGFILNTIEFSGNNVAVYEVLVNSAVIDKKYTSYVQFNSGSNFQGQNLPGYKLNIGDTLEVKVLHTRPYLGNFNAKVNGYNL